MSTFDLFECTSIKTEKSRIFFYSEVEVKKQLNVKIVIKQGVRSVLKGYSYTNCNNLLGWKEFFYLTINIYI